MSAGSLTAGVSDAERSALEAVDDFGVTGWTALLAELIAIPSVTGSSAEADAHHWVAERLSSLGCEVDHWQIDLDAITSDADFPGMEAPRVQPYSVILVDAEGRPSVYQSYPKP